MHRFRKDLKSKELSFCSARPEINYSFCSHDKPEVCLVCAWSLLKGYKVGMLFFFFFLFIFGCPMEHGVQGQGLDPSCSYDLSHDCGNAESSALCARPGIESASQSAWDATDAIVPGWELEEGAILTLPNWWPGNQPVWADAYSRAALVWRRVLEAPLFQSFLLHWLTPADVQGGPEGCYQLTWRKPNILTTSVAIQVCTGWMLWLAQETKWLTIIFSF